MTSAFDVIVLSTRVLYCYINSDVIESDHDDFYNRINKIYNLSDNSFTWILFLLEELELFGEFPLL